MEQSPQDKKYLPIRVWLPILLAVILVFAFFVERSYRTENNVIDNQDPMVNNQADNRPDVNVSNWQIYRNEEFGFEVMYPGDWKMADINNQLWKNVVFALNPPFNPETEYIPEGMVYFQIYDNAQRLSIHQWLLDSDDYFSQQEAEEIQAEVRSGESVFGIGYQEKEVKISGKDAIEQYVGGEGGSQRIILAPLDDKIYAITLGSDYHMLKYNQDLNQYEFYDGKPLDIWRIFDQILSSFKFIN